MDRIRLLALLSLINLIAVPAIAGIGEITEYTGNGMVARSEEEINADLSLPIEMNDYIQTAKGVIGITFDDETQVKVSEHSELTIDDFVYDPSTTQGSLGLKVAMGTVKYASGNIAHSDPDSVDIETPSATIAVRGTAFTMTVDELGKSLVILVPNLDGSVGSIEVSNDVGFVVLNRAFEAVQVSSRDSAPSKPTIISIDENNIDNFMIISPPKEVKDKIVKEAKSSNPLDENELDADLLQADFLETKELEFNELDVSYLDAVIFEDFLRSNDLSASDGIIPGQNSATGVITIKQDPYVEVIRMSSKATFNIKFVEETGINTTAIQGDITINIITLDGQSSNFIRLIQQ
jgi:hypothetical protein